MRDCCKPDFSDFTKYALFLPLLSDRRGFPASSQYTKPSKPNFCGFPASQRTFELIQNVERYCGHLVQGAERVFTEVCAVAFNQGTDCQSVSRRIEMSIFTKGNRFCHQCLMNILPTAKTWKLHSEILLDDSITCS